MNTKKIYDSEKMHGVYRCRKKDELSLKIPKKNDEDTDDIDIVDIVWSGILDFGDKAEDYIRSLMYESIKKIPYDEANIAKKRFYKKLIICKMLGENHILVESAVKIFYSFIDMPTEITRELQMQADIRDIKRYLNCESRTPAKTAEKIMNIGGISIYCKPDFMFSGREYVKTNKRKIGRKYEYDEIEYHVIETVRLFNSSPVVKENSKIIDEGVSSRIDLYAMLKYAEKWCKEHGYDNTNVMLRSSYYYLKKNGENSENKAYDEEFFGKGGNVVSLQIPLCSINTVDEIFEPQIEMFVNGTSVNKDKCSFCSMKNMCEYHDTAKAVEDEQISSVRALPVLSDNQSIAASALSGNIRVIATAGSGKTTAMAYRIMNILKSGVSPEKIGCFTFTNAGANEMRDRIKGFCEISGINADVSKIAISTIHSFGDSLLKRYFKVLGYKKAPTLINEIQKTKIIEKILSENNVISGLKSKYKDFYMNIFRAKGILELMKDYFVMIAEGMTDEDFKKTTALDDNSVTAVYDLYRQYETYKHDMCLIEHHDQELGILKLLEIKPDLFEEVGFEHISIDEYQDTSNVQFKIINAMRQTKCLNSLFIVGDDDQSIYGFRDANVSLIKDFFDMIDDKHGTDVHLMENRRSTGNIVEFAAKLIRNNHDRIEKNPVSTNETGNPVNVIDFADKESELSWIVDGVSNCIKSGINPNDIAILAPTNNELLVLADMFSAAGIETISINPEPVLDNPKVRGAVSLVHFILNNSHLDAVNFLNVQTSGGFMKKEDSVMQDEIVELASKVRNITTVDDLFEWFVSLDKDESDEIYQSFLDGVKTAQSEAIKNDRLNELLEYIIDFERFGQKETARRERRYNGVTLSTMHSSKGKEWPIVFCSVTKMHGKDMKESDIPEKNRLLFVACTRAKKELYITGVTVAYGSSKAGDTENLFLAECRDVEESMYFRDRHETLKDGLYV